VAEYAKSFNITYNIFVTKEEKYKSIQKELDKLYPDPHSELIYANPWEFLVAVILSARNTDKKVNEVTARLFKKYRTLDDYRKTPLEEFEKDIAQIGFFRQKAKSIKKTADVIAEKHSGRVPDNMEDLTELAGVGRKTANVILSEIYNKPEGIVVDTHVMRLARLFGLTDKKDPEKIEMELMEIVPKNKWRDFPLQLILYGRYHHKANGKLSHPLEKYIV